MELWNGGHCLQNFALSLPGKYRLIPPNLRYMPIPQKLQMSTLGIEMAYLSWTEATACKTVSCYIPETADFKDIDHHQNRLDSTDINLEGGDITFLQNIEIHLQENTVFHPSHSHPDYYAALHYNLEATHFNPEKGDMSLWNINVQIQVHMFLTRELYIFNHENEAIYS